MRKRDEILRIVNSYVIDSPSPSNISYMWNFGSLLGLMLVWQMVTGISLGMHYSALTGFNTVVIILGCCLRNKKLQNEKK